MSASFPYFAIAKRFDVPYGQVLAQVDRFEPSGPRNTIWLWPVPEEPIADAIYSAWRAEKTRRFMVMEEQS